MRVTALAALAACVAALGWIVSSGGSTPAHGQRIASQPARHARATRQHLIGVRRSRLHPAAPRKPKVAQARASVRVGEAVLHFVDAQRTMVISGRSVARAFDAVVRYPIGLLGPFPLIVFGHGFAVSPAPYSDLLDAWTRAGYVVVAPIFPLENANAPGGPDERDLPNQPGDISLIISSLSPPPVVPGGAQISSMIDVSHIAVSGQSDGGDTALAAAYGPARDNRITAAVILSGAEDPFAPSFQMPAGGPPLLAVQGTADTINPPWQTYQFFDEAPPPKYLLKLIGAGHQPPYTVPGPTLTTVEQMTIAFLDRYLKDEPAGLASYVSSGAAGPGTTLTAQP